MVSFVLDTKDSLVGLYIHVYYYISVVFFFRIPFQFFSYLDTHLKVSLKDVNLKYVQLYRIQCRQK